MSLLIVIKVLAMRYFVINSMRIMLSRYQYLMALMGGSLLPFAFAPLGWAWLVWPALLCLLQSWQQCSPRQALLNGWLFGVTFFGIGLYWLYYSIHVFGQAPLILAILITSFLVAILALFPALLAWLVTRIKIQKHPPALIQCLLFAALWTLLEIIRSVLLTGFPWLLLGYSQNNTIFANFAPLIGTYGISFMICFSSALLFVAMQQLSNMLTTRTYAGIRQPIILLALLATLWLSAIGCGWLAHKHPFTQSHSDPLAITLVQGNVSQAMKWSPLQSTHIIKQYQQLSNQHWRNHIVIWPEAAIPMAKQSIDDWLNTLAMQARRQHSTLITGIPIFNEQQQGFYNSLIALGEFSGRYDKSHLVPFGEYTPWHAVFSKLLQWINIPMSNLIAGKQHQALLDIKNIQIAPFICYEIAFSTQVFANLPTANLLLVISDDSWFGHSSAAAQHLQIAQMRALETGRPILFVSNGGISAVINALGQLQVSAPAYQNFVITATVQPYRGQTPLLMIGQSTLLILLLLLLLVSYCWCSKQNILQPQIFD